MASYHRAGQKSCRTHVDNRIELAPIRAQGGGIVGRVILENDRRIFDRPVNERTRFRLHDAWPLGAGLLDQLRRWRVDTVRYRGPSGTYETSLSDFLSRAIRMDFKHEQQLVLPRQWWPIRPPETAAASRDAKPDRTAHVEQLDLLAAVAP